MGCQSTLGSLRNVPSTQLAVTCPKLSSCASRAAVAMEHCSPGSRLPPIQLQVPRRLDPFPRDIWRPRRTSTELLETLYARTPAALYAWRSAGRNDAPRYGRYGGCGDHGVELLLALQQTTQRLAG